MLSAANDGLIVVYGSGGGISDKVTVSDDNILCPSQFQPNTKNMYGD